MQDLNNHFSRTQPIILIKTRNTAEIIPIIVTFVNLFALILFFNIGVLQTFKGVERETKSAE